MRQKKKVKRPIFKTLNGIDRAMREAKEPKYDYSTIDNYLESKRTAGWFGGKRY